MNKLNVTSVKLNVKNVMECMRALELDGLVEAVKPLWDVRVPGDDAFDDDEGHVGNLRNKRNGDNDDYDKRSKWTEREKNKMKERMKDIKRREKEKEKEKEKERDTTRVKDKRKKERTKAKAKEKERERKAKRKRKEKVRQQEQLRGRSESIKPTARPKKRRKIVEDDDSEPPLISVDDEGNLDRMQQKKMERIPSVSSASSSPASSRPASSASSASSSPSSSSNSEIDSGSDSEISVSSVDSADLDVRAVQLKPKFSTAFAAAHSQSLSFAGAGLQDLSDTAIIYRATNRLTIPRGLNQTPCGKCPQFGFCEEGGPVNADSCRYYADWLGDRVGGWDAEGRNRFHPVDGECEEEAATQEFEGEED